MTAFLYLSYAYTAKLQAEAAAKIEQHVLLISGAAAPLVASGCPAVRGHFTAFSLQKSIHTIHQPVIMSPSQVSSCNQTSPNYILTKQYRLEHSPSSVLKTQWPQKSKTQF